MSESDTRSELQSHIEAGNWAAVGATAALLAAASESQSEPSRQSTDAALRSRDYSTPDAARAAELDELVEAGDWEGLVVAAAKYEASDSGHSSTGQAARRPSESVESSIGSPSGSQAGDSDTGTETGTATGTIGSTSASDDPSKARRRAEYRSEVEALVRRVVPEELDNVDEMMTQFRGREEELVETLRNMQERSIAQKARAAGQRAAKVEAKQKAKLQRSPRKAGSTSMGGGGATTAAAAASSQAPAASSVSTGGAVAAAIAGASATTSSAGSHGGSGTSSSGASSNSDTQDTLLAQRSALDEAIEAGDWRAVGQAAAFLSDVSSANTAAVSSRWAEISTSSPGRAYREAMSGIQAERTAQLDRLIASGDWNAVVETARRFADDDKKGRTKEEEEALAQAEVWMQIAEQKKREGGMDAGASDAAEWAIQRSFSEMKKAEQENKDKKEGGSSEGSASDEV